MQELQHQTNEIGPMFELAKKLAVRYRQVGLTEPDDIVQNAMLRLLNLATRKDGRYPTLRWIYKALTYSALDACRIAARDRRIICEDSHDHLLRVCEHAEEYDQVRLNGRATVRDDDIEIDVLPRLKNVLQGLKKPLRQVLLLYAEGHSYRQIAVMTNTNVGTVRSRLHYARRRTRKLLSDFV